MHNSPCLNCNSPLQDNYCAHCGQKASTHRLSMKHFFVHDLVHGIWHLDKGIIYTLRGAVLAPGKVAKAYISGKRVGHYNVITLLLMLFAVTFYLQHHLGHTNLYLEVRDRYGAVKQYPASIGVKSIVFSFVPIFALSAWMYFKRVRYNYTEHLVAATFTLIGVLVIQLVLNLLDWTVTQNFISAYNIDWCLYGIFVCFSYYHLLGSAYSKGGFLGRILLTISTFIIIWLFIMLSIYKAFNLSSFAFVSVA